MDYRTIDDMYDRGTLVRLTDLWTLGSARYRDRAAVVIDIEVLGYPRTISRQENGTAISEKYDCIYTVALMPDEQTSAFVRAHVPVIRVISAGRGAELGRGIQSCKLRRVVREGILWRRARTGSSFVRQRTGRVIGGAVLPHTIPMYEARHRARRSSQQIFGCYRSGAPASGRVPTRRDCVGIDSLDAAGWIFYRRRREARRWLRCFLSRRGAAAFQFSRRSGAGRAYRRSCAQRGIAGQAYSSRRAGARGLGAGPFTFSGAAHTAGAVLDLVARAARSASPVRRDHRRGGAATRSQSIFRRQRRIVAHLRFFQTAGIRRAAGRTIRSARQRMARERPAWQAPRHERRRFRNLEPGRTSGTSLYDARRARQRCQRAITLLSGEQRDGIFDDALSSLIKVPIVPIVSSVRLVIVQIPNAYGFQPFACNSAATFFVIAKLKNLSSGGASLTPALLSTASNALRCEASVMVPSAG